MIFGFSLLKKGGCNVETANLLASSGDVDFMVHGLFSYELFGQTFWITTTHVSILIVMIVILVFAVAARIMVSHAQKYPTGFQNVVEMIVEMLDGMVESNMGVHAKKFRNYIGTIFIFILLSNISGLVGLRPPTADYGVTLPLGLITFAMIQYNNIKYNKFGAFTDLFKPLPFLFPINLIGELATPFSLSLRLFGNVLSGTVMMSLIYSLLSKIAIGWPGFLHIYFDLFSGAIQTYVFCMLTMVFVTQKIPSEE
jgi:F-type H+-transporting ATPase subunit a